MKKHIWLSLPALALCLLLAFGTSAAAFSDVPAGAWYFSAVETAFAHDAFRLHQGRFRPEEPITREEMDRGLTIMKETLS